MLLAAIADDLTGAVDLALMLARHGMKARLSVGIPAGDADFGDADAVVVALKSRTAPAAEAVASSLAAATALRRRGAEQLIFKYCSTFDSTDAGNIGPVADALLDVTGQRVAIACPAFPAAGRSVYQGHLFVGEQLLSASPMKDHPLTPMRDADLVHVLQRQSRLRVGLIPWNVVAAGAGAVREAIALAADEGYRLLIADAVRDADLFTLGEALDGARLVTGGSGIGMGLPQNFRRAGRIGARPLPSRIKAPPGRAAILAGSCSAATRGQIETAMATGFPARSIDPLDVASGVVSAAGMAKWMEEQTAPFPPIIYSSASPDTVKAVQARLGPGRAGALIEQFLAEVAGLLAAGGFSRFIIAGGETSGAAVEALKTRVLEIGPEIAPGVPWTLARDGPEIALALKSGNFGGPAFFKTALDMLDD